MKTDNYIVKSLEQHLFFGRIMKEHALFLKAGFTPANVSFSKKAEFFKNEFEKLLSTAVNLSEGIINCEVLNSDELVTDFTVSSERNTEAFTGISINKNITLKELQLKNFNCNNTTMVSHCKIRELNRKALGLLDGLISFKKLILQNVLNCQMFTMNYPLLIEHIIREATLYRDYIKTLENDGCLTDKTMQKTECFWNRIMMEHALFIRGLLDPSETELIVASNSFADKYSNLLAACNSAHNKTLTTASLDETTKFRDFKITGTQGILQCKVKSVILPLLADHVLREANHYIRLLKTN